MSNVSKVAIVTPVGPERGGIGNVAWHQARLLASRGCAVTVLTPDYGYPKPSAPHPNQLLGEERGQENIPSPFQGEGQGEGSDKLGFKLELLKPVLKYGNAAWVPSLKEKLKDYNTVILHYPFFGGGRAVLAAKKKYGFKLVAYYHMAVAGRGWKRLVFAGNTKFFLPRLLKAADAVATSSADLGEHANLGKFQVLPIGVEINKFAFSDKERERVILFVGVLDAAHYFKGLEVLIRAISLLSLRAKRSNPEIDSGIASVAPQDAGLPRNDSWQVVIVGEGELKESYKKLAQELGVADKIVFAGVAWGQDKINWMQKALVTVLPSIDSESFGIVLVESMACGTPVIATDLSGVRSVFSDKVSGFIVPPGDVEALAEKIEYTLNNPEQMRAMGAAGRKLVEEKYDWERIGEKLEKLIRD